MAVQLLLVVLLLTVYNMSSSKTQLKAGELLSLPANSSVLVAGNLNAHYPVLQSWLPY